MDTLISFGHLANVLNAYGPFGLLIVIWYFDMRAIRKLNEQYRNDMSKILSDHKKYMDEIRDQYKNNVKLVENNESLAGDLKEVVIMNTQAMTHLGDLINQNQFCPAQRVEKKKIEVQL